MKKPLLFLSFLFAILTTGLLAQYDYVITLNNDTIFGNVKEKNFYSAFNIKITSNNETLKFKQKQLKELYHNGERYVRVKEVHPYNYKKRVYRGFLKTPLVDSGGIKAYKYNKTLLINYDNTHTYLWKWLKYFADDYPKTERFLDTKKNADSLTAFIEEYNTFKHNNPDSKNYYEKNLHLKKLISPQAALNFTGVMPSNGYIGAELGLTKSITLSPKISFYFFINQGDRSIVVAIFRNYPKVLLFTKTV